MKNGDFLNGIKGYSDGKKLTGKESEQYVRGYKWEMERLSRVPTRLSK